jgi:hypothetical protein
MADMYHAVPVDASPDKVYGTMRRFTHGNWRSTDVYCAIRNSTWGELMYRLKDAAEGKRPGPRWTK